MPGLQILSAENRKLIAISVAFFALNQLIEIVMISTKGVSYTSLCYWDCHWYKSILDHGYDLKPHAHERGDAANWAFFPVFPLIAHGVKLLTGASAELALILTGKLLFLLAIPAFVKLCMVHDRSASPAVCAAVAALNPYAVYGGTGYTESAFLLLSCLSLIFLKQRRYILSGLCGGILSGVRVVGLALGFAYVIFAAPHALREPNARGRILLGLLLIPLGLALFMLFLHALMGDALAFSHVQRAWSRQPQNPFTVLIYGYSNEPKVLAFYANIALAFAAIAYQMWKRNYELAAFSLCCTLLPLSTGLWAMPRYVWWQAPVLMAVADFASIGRLAYVIIPLFAAGLAFMYHAWLRGMNFIV